jgi:hypothetical protein
VTKEGVLFLKKEPKNFFALRPTLGLLVERDARRTSKSFLLLFFKKEESSFPSNRCGPQERHSAARQNFHAERQLQLRQRRHDGGGRKLAMADHHVNLGRRRAQQP